MPTGEPIGKDYDTLMPDLTDIADIQEAFKMYHYGLTSYTGVETIPANSIEGHFGAANQRITDLENRPIGGGEVKTTEPTVIGVDNLPVPDGYIWVDSDANVSTIPDYPTVIYSPTEPTGLGVGDVGTIWVDEDGSAAVLNINNYLTTASASATYATIVSVNDLRDAAAAASFMLMGA